MRVNIKINLTKGTDPQKTVFLVKRIRWDRRNRWIRAYGVVVCGDSRWEHEQVFYIPYLLRFEKKREEILKKLPLRID